MDFLVFCRVASKLSDPSGNGVAPASSCILDGTCYHRFLYRADSSFVPSQLEMVLLCNDISHWLGASLESALLNVIFVFSTGAFQAMELIVHAVVGALDEPLADCISVHFPISCFKLFVCKFDIAKNTSSLFFYPAYIDIFTYIVISLNILIPFSSFALFSGPK